MFNNKYYQLTLSNPDNTDSTSFSSGNLCNSFLLNNNISFNFISKTPPMPLINSAFIPNCFCIDSLKLRA